MKEQLLEAVRDAPDPAAALNLAREYLQARILLALQEAGAMIPLALRGGTALRFLFGLPRFSEDLDFALERPERGDLDIPRLAERVVAQLEREGYEVASRRKVDRVVQSIMVSFPGLLYDIGLAAEPSRRLNVRIEVDTKPPGGAGLATTVVRRQAVLNLQHHDRPSLLAGKLHAVLERTWAKGRDWFDLFWYLSDPTWPAPNLVLLNNALRQTGSGLLALDEATWRRAVRDRLAVIDWIAVERDVTPFLEPGPTARILRRESLLQVVSSEASRSPT